jgi:hypothetical protein
VLVLAAVGDRSDVFDDLGNPFHNHSPSINDASNDSVIVTDIVTTADTHVAAINGPVGSAMTGIRRPSARRHPAPLRESAAAIAGRHG